MKDQLLLDLIATTFSSTLASPDLPNQLQELKKHLFNRSFDEAFPTTTSTTSNAVEDGCERSESNLKAYIVRWVPTRALCYARIFERIAKFLPDESLHVVCVGAGCGSETLALQASLKCQCTGCYGILDLMIVNLDVMDSCPEWEGLLSRITEAANSSSSLTDANVRFQYADVVKQFAKYADVFRTTDLVTLMFTLNELVTAQGKVPATKFLIDLVKTIPKGSLVLVRPVKTQNSSSF